MPGANFFGLVSQCAQIVPVPGAADARERRREGEAVRALADRLAEHALEVRAERVRAALVGIVAGGALLEDLLARGRRRRSRDRKRSASRPPRRLRLPGPRPQSDSPSARGARSGTISPVTIEAPRATIPANRVQPAMVLKRSSMGLRSAVAEANRMEFAPLFKDDSAVHQAVAAANAPEASLRWRSGAAAGRRHPGLPARAARTSSRVNQRASSSSVMSIVSSSSDRPRMAADHQRRREGPGLAGSIGDVRRPRCRLPREAPARPRPRSIRPARGSRRAPNSDRADIAAGVRAAAVRHARRA